MHILHVDTGRTMRGGQWQVLLLCLGLKQRGIEQTALARGQLRGRLEAEGIPCGDPGWMTVRRAQASVIHAHDARAHTLAVAALRHPLVVARRVAFPVRRGRLSRLKYSRADLYLAVSRFVAGRLREGGVDDSRIRVVYDGVEAMPLVPAGSGKIILAPFFDDPQKGSVILEESGLPIEYSKQLKADLARARVFVYLSLEEGLGSGALLAQAAGVPVVASRVGGLPEVVIDGETGLLTGNNAAAVREAVERLDRDPALAARLAANARRRFAECFTVDRMVEATLAAYREVARS